MKSLDEIRTRAEAATDGRWESRARTDISKLLAAAEILEDLIASLEDSSEFTSDPRLLAKLLRCKLDEALEGGAE